MTSRSRALQPPWSTWSMPVLLLLPLLLLLLLDPAAAAPDYCGTAWVWLPDGSRKQQSDWSSSGQTTSFGKGPCLQVSGIGAQVTQVGTLIIVDRNGATNTYATVNGKPAYGEEVNLNTKAQRGLDVLTNTFCSTGQFTPDGRLLSIGGDYTYGTGQQYLGGGISSVRSFTPCTNGQCKFSIAGQIQKGRWYPTALLLGDGRIMVVGGANNGASLNSKDLNVPYIEYIPNNNKGPYFSQFLVDTLPYNLYPFVHLLPSGKVFVFAGAQYMLWDTAKNAPVEGTRPQLIAYNSRGTQIFRNYPCSGTSVLLPLTSANGYNAEIMICGGTSKDSFYKQGGNADAPADNNCFLITPEGKNPKWTATPPMKAPRVMPMAVLLPDGKVFIHGGASTGWAGLGTTCHKAVLQPQMWDTYKRAWYTGPALATSKVPRVYHASAMLTATGAVLITGSNPKTSIQVNQYDFPTEFRSEYFYPAYMPYQSPRPVIHSAPGTIYVGTKFNVKFSFSSAAKIFVVLTHPGFSTHSYNQGMRNVLLDVKGLTNNGGGYYTVTVAAPPNKNIAPPAWYWLWVLENGIPNTRGWVVYVK